MKPMVPVSIGELLDKLSILAVKAEKITDRQKLAHVSKETGELEEVLGGLSLQDTDTLKNQLKAVNSELWDIEDAIRQKEREGLFDKEFIELARSVYKTNDKRFQLKDQANRQFGSHIVEVKSYEEY